MGARPSSTTRVEDRSELVILDATNFGGEPVATVALPQRVPFGFHGIWEPASD